MESMHSSHTVVVQQRIDMEFVVPTTLWSMKLFRYVVEHQDGRQFGGLTIPSSTLLLHAAVVQEIEDSQFTTLLNDQQGWELLVSSSLPWHVIQVPRLRQCSSCRSSVFFV